MQLNRIHVSEEVDQRLRSLKAKTRLTPNLLCRIGFCLSLREPMVPNLKDYGEDSAREFNRYTLTGPWDRYFVALLTERCNQDGLLLPDCLEEQFLAHLNRGVILLFQRVKHLGDILRLIEEVQPKGMAE
jgi:DNA sulfur modification protein DndE